MELNTIERKLIWRYGNINGCLAGLRRSEGNICSERRIGVVRIWKVLPRMAAILLVTPSHTNLKV